MASSVVAAVAKALQLRGRQEQFPGITEQYWGMPWQDKPWELDFPKAASLVPIVYALTSRISQDVAALPLRWYRRPKSSKSKRTEIERQYGDPTKNPADLWGYANPEQSGYELGRDEMLSRLNSGNTYLYMEFFLPPEEPVPDGKVPEELWVVPGHMMKPIPGPRRGAVAYEYQAGGRTLRFLADRVIHLRMHNPDWSPLEPAPVGMSPLQAAKQSYEARWNMGRWIAKLYERGGANNLVMSVKDGAAVTDEQIELWQKKDERRYSGLEKAFLPRYVRGMDVVKGGMTLEEMQFVEAAALTDADLCRIFGVPPVIMGIKQGGGLSDAGATTDKLLYVQNAIEPAVRLRDAVLTEFLCPFFGDDVMCETDLSGMWAVQEAIVQRAEAYTKLAGRPIFTVNQVMGKLGEDDQDDPTADELLVPSNMSLSSDLETKAEDAANAQRRQQQQKPAAKEAAAPVPVSGILSSGRRKAELDARKAKAEARMARYEKAIRSWALAHFDEQQRRMLEAHDPKSSGLAFVADDFDEMDAQEMFRRILLERGVEAANEAGVEVAVEIFAQRVSDLAKRRGAQLVTGLDQTTKDQLARAISDAAAENAGIYDMTAVVRQVFDDRRANAATIARTETTWAYNTAAYEAWDAAGVTEKSWLTVGDDVVRESHAACEAEGPIHISGRFSNGLSFPGEQGAPAEEVINCRCVIQAEPGTELKARKNGSRKGLERIFARARAAAR